MCVIIDINTFPLVFDKNSKNHNEFKPVLDWVIDGKGKIVYGGSKYNEELKRLPKYLKVLGQLNRFRKLISINSHLIDKYQEAIEKLPDSKGFNDPHLVAIAFISKCEIICSLDKKAHPYLNKKTFYPNNSPRPKIYSGIKSASVISDKYITKICLPCVKLTKEEIKLLA